MGKTVRQVIQEVTRDTTPLVKRKCIVDAGYMSYIYGIQETLHGWYQARTQMPFVKSVLFMDSWSARKRFYPEYKSARKKKRKDVERQRINFERVKNFRKFLSTDAFLPALSYNGLEADDLVAIWFILYRPPLVVAVDKDLQQIPGIQLMDVNMLPRNLTRSRMKYPIYAWEGIEGQPKPTKYRRLLWYQAMAGDKSDSIPRLLSSSGSLAKAVTQKAWELPNLFQATYEDFGKPFLRNLKLVLMPWYQSRNDWGSIEANPEYLMELMDTRNYWHPQFWKGGRIERSLKSQFEDWASKSEDGNLAIIS